MIHHKPLKISIVTISFNQVNYLKDCIESVVSQKYENFEYIIVDPGSTDGSRELIESYSDKVSNIIFEPDTGAADGLNKGFRLATGDIYYFLNSDDMILPDALKKVSLFFQLNADIDVLVGNGYRLEKNKKTLIKSDDWNLDYFKYGANCIFQQSTFFRATSYINAKGFNVNNSTCWDGELWVDIALSGAKFKLINECFGLFRIHPDSISGSNRLYKKYKKDQLRISSKINKTNENKYLWDIKSLFFRTYRKLSKNL